MSRIRITEFSSLHTRGDSSDQPPGSLAIQWNMRNVDGQLEKTFGFGAVDPAIDAVVPGAGNTVINILAFPHEKFTSGFAYFAIIHDTDANQVTVKYWDNASTWQTMSGSETPIFMQEVGRNPYVIDKNILRVLPGATGSIDQFTNFQSIGIPSGNSWAICEHQGYLIAALGTLGLRAYSVDAETGKLTAVGAILKAGGDYRGVCSDGSYVYVANYVTPVVTHDLIAYSFNGTTFVEIDTISTAVVPNDIWTDGTYIFLATAAAGGLRSYTFDGVTLTAVDSEARNTTTYVAVWGDGTYVYTASRGGDNGGIIAWSHVAGTLTYVDEILASAWTGGVDDARSIWGDGTYIYVANGSGGLHAFTFDGTTLTEVGHIDDGDNAYGVYWSNGTIFLGNAGGGIRAYTFDGSTFTCTANEDDGGTYYRPFVHRGFVYAPTGGSGIDAYTYGVGANGAWIGWIKRGFYDEKYYPGEGWWVTDCEPKAPYPYEPSTGATLSLTSDISIAGTGDYDISRYIRYTFIYDGIQESLLSEAYTAKVDEDVEKLWMSVKLYDADLAAIRSNRRITGMRFYLMDSILSTSLATLITEVSFLRKEVDIQEVHGKRGLSGGYYVWINKDLAAAPVPGTTEFSVDTVDWKGVAEAIDMGTNGWILKLDDFEPETRFGGKWYLSGLTGATSDSGTTECFSGSDVIIDPSKDFNQIRQSVTDLSVLGITSTPGLMFDVFSDKTFKVAPSTKSAKYALQVHGYMPSTVTSFEYIIGGHPYLFYRSSGCYYMAILLDLNEDALEGSPYQLQDVPSIKVNSDHAKIIDGRMWKGYNVLDPGGADEEQFAAVNYSEQGQPDVMPVGNIIRLHDREGGGVTGISELFGNVVVALKQGLFKIDTGSSNLGVVESPHNIGNLAHHGMLSVAGKVYVCWEDGIYALSSNDLAETDATPTKMLRISDPIEDVYTGLTRAKKQAIQAVYQQETSEIVYALDSGVIMYYNVVTGEWRSYYPAITLSLGFFDIDENADVLLYNATDKKFYTDQQKDTVLARIQTNQTWLSDERKELLRYIIAENPYSDALTVTPYLDGSAGTGVVVPASTANYKVPVGRRCYRYAVRYSWAASKNSNIIKEIGIEHE